MFFECRRTSSAELYLVEGRSAAAALNAVRNKDLQAVYALQGKIPNSSTATGLRKALRNNHVKGLMQLLQPDQADSLFERIYILCDADADGLHARSLLDIFFRTHLQGLVEDQSVFHIYPPLFHLVSKSTGIQSFGWRREDLDRLSGSGEVDISYYKGIASMPANILFDTCLCADGRCCRLLALHDSARQ